MIARVTWGKIKPGKWEVFEKLWNDYAHSVADASGSRGRILLHDHEQKDAGYAISFWDDEASFDAFKAAAPSPEEMQDCFVGQYITTVTNVSGATLAGLSS